MSSPTFTSDFHSVVNIAILNSLGFFFLDFLIPYVATVELQASGQQMGLIFSVRTIGYLSIASFAGSLSDNYSPKKLIIMGSTGRGLAYFVLYYAIVIRDLWMMVFGNLFLGIMAGFFWIPLDIIVSNKSKASHRSEAFGYRSAAIGKGTALGAIVGFTVFNTFSEINPDLRLMVYLPLAIYGLGNILAALQYARIDESLTIQEGIVVQERLSYRGFFGSLSPSFRTALVVLFVTIFLTSVNGSLAKPFLLVYLTTNIESNPSLASAAYIPERLTLTIGIALGAITTLLLISTTSLLVFSLLLILDMSIATATGLIVVNIFSRISVQNRGKIFGLQTVFGDLGAILGPLAGGFLWDALGQKSPFYLSVGVEFLIIPVILYAYRLILPFLSEKI
ncbi:MAG: MFS transporter [Candidatus Kariarchaeaceae archaeon]|jgi:MFS family permease